MRMLTYADVYTGGPRRVATALRATEHAYAYVCVCYAYADVYTQVVLAARRPLRGLLRMRMHTYAYAMRMLTRIYTGGPHRAATASRATGGKTQLRYA
jgi:hypothetical protein